MRFERRWALTEQTPEQTRRFEHLFEGTARATFRNDVPAMLAVRDRAAAALACGADPTLDWRLAASLRVRIDPPIMALDTPAHAAPVLRVRSLYIIRTPQQHQARLSIEVVDAQGRILTRTIQPVWAGPKADGIELDIPLDPARFAPGRYAVQLRTPRGRVVRTGVWHVAEHSLDTTRRAMRATLDHLPRSDLRSAIAIARSRTALVTDAPSINRTVGLVTDPRQLAGAISREIDAIARGHDPYASTTGHLWRTFEHQGRAVPLRVYVPPGHAGPRPLVVALHGISADESTFLDGYGHGLLTRLADEHGFVIASPLSYALLTSDAPLDAVIDAASAHATIDRDRVLVLGYSMGGSQALRLAQTKRDRLAGVCAITGGTRLPTDPHAAPTLIVAGRLDPLLPAELLTHKVDQAAASGVPIELLIMPDSSHILIVSAAMPKAIQWLLAQEPTQARLQIRISGADRPPDAPR